MSTTPYGSYTNLKRSIMNDVPDKESKVLELRKRGMSYDAIAKELGYADRTGPHQVVKRWLERIKTENYHSMEELREIELQKLDDMLEKNNKQMDLILTSGLDPLEITKVMAKLQDTQLKIMDRRAKLVGLDAPTRVETNVTMSHEDALKELEDEPGNTSPSDDADSGEAT